MQIFVLLYLLEWIYSHTIGVVVDATIGAKGYPGSYFYDIIVGATMLYVGYNFYFVFLCRRAGELRSTMGLGALLVILYIIWLVIDRTIWAPLAIIAGVGLLYVGCFFVWAWDYKNIPLWAFVVLVCLAICYAICWFVSSVNGQYSHAGIVYSQLAQMSAKKFLFAAAMGAAIAWITSFARFLTGWGVLAVSLLFAFVLGLLSFLGISSIEELGSFALVGFILFKFHHGMAMELSRNGNGKDGEAMDKFNDGALSMAFIFPVMCPFFAYGTYLVFKWLCHFGQIW